MDVTTISQSLVFWSGLTRLAPVLWSIRVLASWRTRRALHFTIDGRSFHIPPWTFAAAMQQLTLVERTWIAEAGTYELVLRRAQQALKAAKRSTPLQRWAAQEALKDAKRAYARAQRDSHLAFTTAVRRWLLSTDGQAWLQSKRLRFL
jgi:hypothetical protein